MALGYSKYEAGTSTTQTTLTELTGVLVTETAGTPAAARATLRDGSASGTVFMDIKVAASGTVFIPCGLLRMTTGAVHITVATGTVQWATYGN